MNHQLDERGIGAGADLECYRSLKPGRRILLWYPDDHVWHETLICLIVGGEDAVIYTPDKDMYIESLGCKGVNGPSKIRRMDGSNRIPAGLRGRVYRFRDPVTDELVKGLIRDAIHLVKQELWQDAKTPPLVVNSACEEVTIDSFFGGSFVRNRLGPVKTGVEAANPTDCPRNARKVRSPPVDYVWLAAEPLGGLSLGQEMSLNEDTDVQIGDSCAIALRGGMWVKAELVKISDAFEYGGKRRSLFGQSIQPAEKTLVDRLKPADETLAPDDGEDKGDVRTLWIDYDEHGERYKRWRDVCCESHSPTLSDKPLDGPITGLHLINHVERHGGDPRLWLQLWLRAKHIEPTDRVAHEMRVLCDVLYYAGTFDQLNIPALVSLEVVCRRMQAVVDAYTNPSKPSWENAKIFTGQGSPEDLVSPTFRSYATRKNRDELELLQARQKVRELRGSPHAVQEEAPADALDSLPLKPKAKAKNRPGGGRGQGDGWRWSPAWP